MSSNKIVLQFVKFGFVGVFNTLSSTCYYWIFLYLGVNYILATTVAYLLASFIGYLLNNKWVFNNNGLKNSSFIKYYVVYGVSYFLNIGCMYLWVDILNLSKFIAPLLTLLVTVPFNFIFSKIWVFRREGEQR